MREGGIGLSGLHLFAVQTSGAQLRSQVLQRVSSRAMRCKEGVKSCSISNADLSPTEMPPVVVFISKMSPMKLSDLAPEDAAMIRQQRRAAHASRITSDPTGDGSKIDSEGESDVLMALGRVFSGTLTKNDSYFVLNHRHRPVSLVPDDRDLSEEQWRDVADSTDSELESKLLSNIPLPSSVSRVSANTLGLYICFGPSIKSVEFMPAGNIVGIIGLEQHVLKTGTLSSSCLCPPMRPISFQAKPILRVAVEPMRHQDLPALELGLKAWDLTDFLNL